MMNKQNEEILKNVKLKISISKFEEEEEKEMKINKVHIGKIGLVACCMIVSITGIVFAKDISIYLKNFFGANSSDGVDIAVNNGYMSELNTEYQKADGIDIKVESILMDDFNFDMNFNVKINEQYNIDNFEHIDFEDLKIVDENANIVFDTHAITQNTAEKHYRGSYSFLPNKISENEFRVSLSATGNPELFPKSKHLKVDLSKIRTWQYVNEERTDKVYEGNWHFEIDVPEEFYNRESIIYKAKSCNDNSININEIKATLSKTALKIYIPEMKTNKVNYNALHNYDGVSISNMIAIQKEYVETSDGKRFETARKK